MITDPTWKVIFGALHLTWSSMSQVNLIQIVDCDFYLLSNSDAKFYQRSNFISV